MPPACFLNAPTKERAQLRGDTPLCPLLIISPGYVKISVPPSPGGDDHCMVQPQSVLLPGRDCVRGVEFFSDYHRRSASEAGARTAIRKCLKISAFFAPVCWVFPKRGAKASLFGSFFFHIFCRVTENMVAPQRETFPPPPQGTSTD